MKIAISKQQHTTSRGTIYDYGTLTDDSGKTFEFTLTSFVNDNPDHVTTELTWVDDTPEDNEDIEETIMEKFDEMEFSEDELVVHQS